MHLNIRVHCCRTPGAEQEPRAYLGFSHQVWLWGLPPADAALRKQVMHRVHSSGETPEEIAGGDMC
ncbi:rCG63059 [Rattus norvegicus]|uniref:RCG63059 n=1 Tax=Rattus norvegicus TaxID=10116 RepID=A6KRD5_RAT|nr:rCG63059 [Rattus norvegicus]